MDWSDTPEQALFRGQVRTFIQERLPAYYRDPEVRRIKAEDGETVRREFGAEVVEAGQRSVGGPAGDDQLGRGEDRCKGVGGSPY